MTEERGKKISGCSSYGSCEERRKLKESLFLRRVVLEISMTTRDSCETCDSCERNFSWNQLDLRISP